jgi:chorismate dehydratase
MGIIAGKKIRFGCHNFLNSQPILIPLLERNGKELEIIQDFPANLALMLKRGELDLSFVPSIEYARNPEYCIINNISISSIGMVDTVLLICKTNMRDVESVAVDNRSLSSILLLKILFLEKYHRLPIFSYSEPDYEKMLLSNDAALIIGDKSFLVKKSKETKVFDLSNEWFRLTEKPFVHALLCVRNQGLINENIIKMVLNSRDAGLSSLERICDKTAQKAGITKGKCMDYLNNKIKYNLGPAEKLGLQEFFSLAHKHGFIEENPDLKFVST